MTPRRLFAAWACLVVSLVAIAPARASFHLWQIVEVYSSSNGSVQFIELLSSGPFETQANGAQIRTDSGNTFSITANLSGDTLNDRLLFATPGFASLPGAPSVSGTQPVYTIPANFFNPANDRIRLFSPSFGEFHSRTINATNPIPTDNVFSRTYSGLSTAIAANSPQARDVTPGSINRGDYNADGFVDAADYLVWRKTLNQAASPFGSGADGSTNGTIDAADEILWTARFGNEIIGDGVGTGGSAMVPEPVALALVSVACAALVVRRPPRRARMARLYSLAILARHFGSPAAPALLSNHNLS